MRVGACTAVVVAFAAYPPIHLMNSAGFEPVVLAMPLLAALVYWALSGNVVRFVVAAIAVLAISTQLALALVGFGVLLSVTVRRRAGIGLIVLGAAGAIGEQTVPWLGAGDHAFVDGVSFEPGVRSAIGVLGHGLVHPLDTMGRLGDHRVLSICAALLLPVALLPLLSLRHLAPVAPLLLAYLLGDVPQQHLLGVLAVAPTVFAFTAATFALGRLGRAGSDRVAVPPRLSAALAGTAVLFFLLQAPSSPYAAPWTWGRLDRFDDVRQRWVDELLERVDADAEDGRPPIVVAATADFSPLLAGRMPLCPLPRERHPCHLEPDLYLVDVLLDGRIAQDPALVEARPPEDGRLYQLQDA
ncbi:MAG: DUF2079 domain-containing protein [Acidimicrobiales bacterium]